MADNAKAIAARYLDAFNKHNTKALAEITAPGFLDHDPLGPGLPPGAEGELAAAKMIFAAFPDVLGTAEEMVAEGDRVVSRITWTGTHKSDFMGLPATGKRANFKEIHVQRVVNGKIVEHWGVADRMTLLQQLGAIPAP